jgi:hypothetical protein
MAKTPPIPKEQQSFRGERADIAGGDRDRRDSVTNAQSADPGDADVNTDEQGRYGNIRQNLTNQHKVQDR